MGTIMDAQCARYNDIQRIAHLSFFEDCFALYNLDLLMNTIQWTAHREDEITIRPKALTPDQYPLTPQQSLDMLYGVGLLIPELLLAAAAWTWVRRRSG